MPDESDLKFVQQLSAAAQSRKLRALLIGGHAVNLHGVSRFTEDFDFLIDRATVASWRELLRSLGFESFRDAATFEQFSREGEGPKRLDLMLVNSGTFEKLFSKALPLPEPSESMRIVCAEHLVALKLHVLKQDLAHRRLRDFLDVVELIKQNKLDLKGAEMKEVFDKFGTPELARKVKLYCEGEV